jgi:hypothetical protein
MGYMNHRHGPIRQSVLGLQTLTNIVFAMALIMSQLSWATTSPVTIGGPFTLLFDLPERTTVCSVILCSRPLRRRDDKQSDPNKYGQQNRQGDKSAKSGQNPNQTPGQQTQNPNQSGRQQRDPQR